MAQTYAVCISCTVIFTGDQNEVQKKTPVLTLPQARLLLIAALSQNKEAIMHAIKKLNYYMKRNCVAHDSHAKKQKALFEKLVV
jgi:hypothetical protein